MNKVGHQPAQTGVRWQPPFCERHRHPRPLARNSELAAEHRRRGGVEDVRVDVGLVAGGREEPRFDSSLAAHALDPTATLREPNVAQTPAKKTPLTLALWNDAESAESLVDHVGIDTFAVVGANELVPPAAQRG